jgi:hypothetical protein
MSQVWLVWLGYYDDGEIPCAFMSEEAATAACDAYNQRVAEIPLAPVAHVEGPIALDTSAQLDAKAYNLEETERQKWASERVRENRTVINSDGDEMPLDEWRRRFQSRDES